MGRAVEITTSIKPAEPISAVRTPASAGTLDMGLVRNSRFSQL